MKRWSRLSLSARILAGLSTGALTGLFLGELAAPLQVVADVYIRLMQMTVIPYVTVALITGLGQLEQSEAKALAVRAGLFLLLLWGLFFVVLVAIPFSFPDWKSASFFSTALIESRAPFDFVSLYVPDNPFHALANSVVPAVVLFSSAVGIALMGVQNKAPLMDGLRVFGDALGRVTRFLVGLTPVGVFAIGAVAAGTLTIEEFSRLQAYFVVFIAAALLLAFWIIPVVVTSLTPFRYRDVVGVAQDALLTAFVTNNVFIVLPILAEESKRLIREYGLQDGDAEAYVDVIIPVAFNLPTVGKLLTLLFVPFAAWLSGTPVELTQYPAFFVTGLVSYFAKAQTALPFLMDVMDLPQDLFQLYIPTSIVNGKFDSLVGAMHLLSLGLVGAGAMAGWASFQPARIARGLIAVSLGIAVTVTGARLFLGATLDTSYTKDELLTGMHLPRFDVRPRVYRELPSEWSAVEGISADETGLGLERIRRRGTLRVGYDPERLPFSFFNSSGDLVGFDVELSIRLAQALDVELELFPVEWVDAQTRLKHGHIDVLPSMPYINSLLPIATLCAPYMDSTLGFVVRDDRRHAFSSLSSLQQLGRLRLGMMIDPELVEKAVAQYLPGVEVDLVQLDHPRAFFENDESGLDGLLMVAESGTAWTLLYPDYSAVVPQPGAVRIPTAFGVRSGDYELAEYLDEWLITQRALGTVQNAYDYWVLGEGAEPHTPRWSILRNVLGWTPAKD